MGVYRHNNGRWYCRGRINGERYHLPCTGAKTKEEAKALEDAERYKIRLRQRGLLEEKEKVFSFSFLMEKYLEVCRANNKDLAKAHLYARVMLQFFDKRKNILTIKPSDVESFRVYLLDTGKSKATVNRYVSALKRAYNILINDELINYNPANKVKKYAEDGSRYRYLTKEEWFRLRAELSPMHLAIVTAALQTGFRKQNVLKLRWEQIDLNSRTIELLKSENKGKKSIKLPITDTLYNLLQSLDVKTSGYVFINPKTGKPYTDIKKAFKSALFRAGINDFRFHDLRRTVGTWLLEEGVNIRTIQYWYAHSELATTECYLAQTVFQIQKAAEILDSYMR